MSMDEILKRTVAEPLGGDGSARPLARSSGDADAHGTRHAGMEGRDLGGLCRHVCAGWRLGGSKPAIREYAYAVLAVSPRALDPGAAKRTHILLLDRREVVRTPI